MYGHPYSSIYLCIRTDLFQLFHACSASHLFHPGLSLEYVLVHIHTCIVHTYICSLSNYNSIFYRDTSVFMYLRIVTYVCMFFLLSCFTHLPCLPWRLRWAPRNSIFLTNVSSDHLHLFYVWYCTVLVLYNTYEMEVHPCYNAFGIYVLNRSLDRFSSEWAWPMYSPKNLVHGNEAHLLNEWLQFESAASLDSAWNKTERSRSWINEWYF